MKKSQIGTWIMRTLQRVRKLKKLKKEIRKAELDILELNERRWKEKSNCMYNEFRIIYSSKDKTGSK